MVFSFVALEGPMFQMRVDSRLNANSQELVLTLMFELCG